MPTLELSKKDLEKLIGKKLPNNKDALEEILMLVKGEIDLYEDDKIVLDLKEANRPDLFSAEGIARELKRKLGIKKGIPKYEVNKAAIEIFVDKSVKNIRPRIVAAVAKNVKINEEVLSQLIQLQEKIANTFGRKRKEAAIGLYDFDKMKPPIYYKAFKNEEIKFVPLDFTEELSPKEILELHPKGKEYAFLLENAERFPIVIDANNAVASMPPIINSEHTGKLNEKTKNVFIEVTGFDLRLIETALKIMCMALADRGAKIEAVKINYADKSIITPKFGTEEMEIDLNYAKEIFGLELSNKELEELLSRNCFEFKIKGNKAIVKYADYRTDILHQVDIIEDMLISYGYNKIEARWPKTATIGKKLASTKLIELCRKVCVGLGLQEVLNYTLSSKEIQAEKMLLENGEFVELANPITRSMEVFRKSLIPQMLEFLSKNKNAAMPQKLFQIGKIFSINESKPWKVDEKLALCIVLCEKELCFTDIKSYLQEFCKSLNVKFELKELEHKSFISGRAAKIIINNEERGIIGEIHPRVLENFKIENPVAVLELLLSNI